MPGGGVFKFHGMTEMPAGSDAEVASLFRDLRVASNLTEADLAARIAAPIEVVQALEQGALYALPPWPETCRVVNAYGTMLNLDTGPLLRRIYAQLEAGVVELGPKAVPDVPVMAPPGAADFGSGNVNAGAPPPAPQATPLVQAPTAPAQVPQAPSPIPWPNGQPQAAPPPAASPQAVQQQAAQPQAPSPQAAWPAAAPPFPQGGIGGALQPAPITTPPQAAPPLAPQPPEAPIAPQAPTAPDAAFSSEQPGQGFPDQPSTEPLMGDDASMGEPEDELEPAPARKKSPLLKWGLVAFLILMMLGGIWTVFGDSSGSSSSLGSSGTSDPVLGPDDPRSRKADRLPNNF
jgi:hypothetical protein